MIFRKWGQFKGCLKFFRKFIRFGIVTHPSVIEPICNILDNLISNSSYQNFYNSCSPSFQDIHHNHKEGSHFQRLWFKRPASGWNVSNVLSAPSAAVRPWLPPSQASSSTPLNQTTPCPTIQGLGLDLFPEIWGLGKVTTAPVDLCLTIKLQSKCKLLPSLKRTSISPENDLIADSCEAQHKRISKHQIVIWHLTPCPSWEC